jgi:ubiquinone/menaquinone biosynthesis C-methylase UbiE
MPGAPLTHATSWRGEAAGVAYERGRPDYPAAAISALVERLELRPGTTVADLAAGTGKLTRLLVPSGARVLAIEPAPGMLAQLHRAVPAALTAAGEAERLPLADGMLNALTVAQAMHWFRPSEAIGEFHRVLHSSGRLAVVYNDRDTREPWVARMTEILNRYEQLAPRPEIGPGWSQAFAATERFAPFEHLEFDHAQTLDDSTFTDRIASMSFVILLDDKARTALLAELRALVADQDPIVMPMRTRVLIASRRS